MAETPEPATVQEEAPLAMAEEASSKPPLPLPLAASEILGRHFLFNTPSFESLVPTRFQHIVAGGFESGATSGAPRPLPEFEHQVEQDNYEIGIELIEMQRVANMRIFADAVEYTTDRQKINAWRARGACAWVSVNFRVAVKQCCVGSDPSSSRFRATGKKKIAIQIRFLTKIDHSGRPGNT